MAPLGAADTGSASTNAAGTRYYGSGSDAQESDNSMRSANAMTSRPSRVLRQQQQQLAAATASASSLTAQPPLPSTAREKRIRVCVRIRPFTKNEAAKAGGKAAWTWHENTIYQQIFPAQAATPRDKGSSSSSSSSSSRENAHLPSSYAFDHLYGPTTHTSQLYEDAVRDSIVAAVDGYHSSVFVYGQTGTGKTHTMLGTRAEPGLLQLAVDDIFSHISRHTESEFMLRFTYLEIYNERVYDLLAGGVRKDIKIYEVARVDPQSTEQQGSDAYACNDVLIKGLEEAIVASVDHVLALVEEGNAYRHTATTAANDHSSRSHTIFRLVIESQTKQQPSSMDDSASPQAAVSVSRSSTLNLVDLAGSESVRLSQTSGHHLKEGRHINQSLLTLGHIIWKLSRGRASSKGPSDGVPHHLPYRNSKLTRILQPALGGKAQITIVCTMAPSVACLAETHSTLKFATRARRVKSKLAINETTGESALLKKYRNRMKELQDEWDELELQRRLEGSNSMASPTARGAAIEKRQHELLFAIENINRVILNSSHRHGGAAAAAAGGGEDQGNEEEKAQHVGGEGDSSSGAESGNEEEEDEEDQDQDQEETDDDDDDFDKKRPSVSPPPHPLRSFKSRLQEAMKKMDKMEPESESHVGQVADQRRNLTVLSNDSGRSLESLSHHKRTSLTTVLKTKYITELAQLTASSATPTDSSDSVLLSPPPPSSSDDSLLPPTSRKELLREFVRGLEIAEAENDTKLSQIRELELENRHLRELLRERDDELAAEQQQQRKAAMC